MDSEFLPALQNQILSLEIVLEQERKAAQNTIFAAQRQSDYYRQKARTPGLGVAVGYGSGGEWVGSVGVVWKISEMFPW